MLIPQLELLAVLVRVRSLDFVSKKLGITDSKPITWMDCQCSKLDKEQEATISFCT